MITVNDVEHVDMCAGCARLGQRVADLESQVGKLAAQWRSRPSDPEPVLDREQARRQAGLAQ